MSDVNQVGEVAGQVWNFLHGKDRQPINAVERNVNAPKPVVYMALGWLAREGKLGITQDKRDVQVWLTER